jgi:hypothetical protein
MDKHPSWTEDRCSRSNPLVAKLWNGMSLSVLESMLRQAQPVHRWGWAPKALVLLSQAVGVYSFDGCEVSLC